MSASCRDRFAQHQILYCAANVLKRLCDMKNLAHDPCRELVPEYRWILGREVNPKSKPKGRHSLNCIEIGTSVSA